MLLLLEVDSSFLLQGLLEVELDDGVEGLEGCFFWDYLWKTPLRTCGISASSYPFSSKKPIDHPPPLFLQLCFSFFATLFFLALKICWYHHPPDHYIVVLENLSSKPPFFFSANGLSLPSFSPASFFFFKHPPALLLQPPPWQGGHVHCHVFIEHR